MVAYWVECLAGTLVLHSVEWLVAYWDAQLAVQMAAWTVYLLVVSTADSLAESKGDELAVQRAAYLA